MNKDNCGKNDFIDGELVTLWYLAHKRDLPWRRDTDPYHVWVSEIMLQQTRVEAVKEYYLRFIKALPSVEALAGAQEDTLLKLWEGLGYYSRVRNMKKAAVIIMEEYDGRFPSDYESIKKLPGIGEYTAGAIASIAFSERVPAIDGNVMRVLARLYGDDGDISLSTTKRRFREYILSMKYEAAPGTFTQAMIELGALICIPGGAPLCTKCPYESCCRARKEGSQLSLPNKPAPKKRSILDYTVLILRDAKEYALRKRPDTGLLAGLYEPVLLEGHLSREEVLSLFPKEEMPLYIERLPDGKHVFSHVEWHMQAYYIKLDELRGTKKVSLPFGELTFVSKEQIAAGYAVPSAFAAYKPYFNGI